MLAQIYSTINIKNICSISLFCLAIAVSLRSLCSACMSYYFSFYLFHDSVFFFVYPRLYSLCPITEMDIWHGRLAIHEIKWRQIDFNLNYIDIRCIGKLGVNLTTMCDCFVCNLSIIFQDITGISTIQRFQYFGG